MYCSPITGLCQSILCDDCDLLVHGDFCSNNDQCSGSFECQNGFCKLPLGLAVIDTPMIRTAKSRGRVGKRRGGSWAPWPAGKVHPLICYWTYDVIDLITACKQGYDMVYFYQVINFGYNYPNPQGILLNGNIDVSPCRDLGVKVVLVLGGGSGDQQASGYSIANGKSLGPLLWKTYFADGRFDGASFDIEGLYGGGTGQDLADIINYFRQQAGSDWIISLAPYANPKSTQAQQAVVREGIAKSQSSISFLNLQTYDVSYDDFTEPTNGLVPKDYEGWASLYPGMALNIGVDLCMSEAVGKLWDVQDFAKQVFPAPNGLFIWSCSCASVNQDNGVDGMGVDDFKNWVHGSFPSS
ncbi:hypothetical protein HDU98_000047 [Podochytrium sp. JEL0797]|nr:hypothetical protein HDU98_000047 [Podochytrium sp. JEL0797]